MSIPYTSEPLYLYFLKHCCCLLYLFYILCKCKKFFLPPYCSVPANLSIRSRA